MDGFGPPLCLEVIRWLEVIIVPLTVWGGQYTAELGETCLRPTQRNYGEMVHNPLSCQIWIPNFWLDKCRR